jgi:hypothetical protein
MTSYHILKSTLDFLIIIFHRLRASQISLGGTLDQLK